jgi:lysophospholipase L1-like esterase
MRRPAYLVLLIVNTILAPVAAAEQTDSPTWNHSADLTRPFWEGTLMTDESVLFIKDTATGESRAAVLFPIEKLIAVRNSAGDLTYQEGRDYRWRPESREIVLPAGSRISSSTSADLRRPPKSQLYELPHKDGNGEIRFGERLEYQQLQTCITYSHASGLWKTSVPKFDATALSRTIARLQAAEPLSVVILGDSISTGCNASGWAGGPPYQPAYPQLLQLRLQSHYHADVAITNLSVGGKDTAWALTMIDPVVAAKPDLVIIAFGANDAHGRPASEYQANTRAVIDRVREKLPEAEFILVASLIGNPNWVSLKTKLFPQYRDALHTLCSNGVVLADVTSLWSRFLELKQDWDHTGNGVNHPNDFGHRVYAQVISSLLVPSDVRLNRASP